MQALDVIRTGPRAVPWRRAGLLALVVVLCYANSLRVPFLFDDPFLSPDLPDIELDYSSRPLVWATFDLNRALSGRDTSGYHVVNLLVHLGCGLLLLGFLRRTLALATGSPASPSRADLALVTTCLWLCHPLQTESVTYLSQRAESLGALFTLGVLYAFLRARTSDHPRPWVAAAWLALALGFLTKETVVAAPLLALLYELVFFARGPLQALRRSPALHGGLALLALAGTALLVAPLLGRAGGSVGFRMHEFGVLEYLRTQPGVILHYLRLAVWPHPLCFDYAWPIADEPAQWLPQAVLILALLAATLWLCLRRSWIGFAGAWFFLILAPSSSFVPIRDPAVEHRMYLPLAAVLVLAVAGARALLARNAGRLPWLAPTLAGLALVALGARTIRRNQDYRTAEGLWRATVALAPHNARAHGNLGSALTSAGREEEAFQALMRGFELAPEDGPILLNLGKAYARRGESERAAWFLRRGVARTKDARGIGSLGTVLYEKGDFTGAALHFREALALTPRDPGAHFRLASALVELGRTDEALQGFARALELAPDFQECRINLAAFLTSLGRLDEALEQSLAALATQPNSALELHNHAQLLDTLGRTEEAIGFMRQALQAEPDLAPARAALVELVLALPEPAAELRQEALRCARDALARAPLDAELRQLLARAEALASGQPAPEPATAEEHFARAQELLQAGRQREALDSLRAAIRLAPETPELRAALAEGISQWDGASAEERREALAQAERALELAGGARPDLLAVLALAAAALGEFERALAALDQAIGLPEAEALPEFQAELRALRAELEQRAGR